MIYFYGFNDIKCMPIYGFISVGGINCNVKQPHDMMQFFFVLYFLMYGFNWPTHILLECLNGIWGIMWFIPSQSITLAYFHKDRVHDFWDALYALCCLFYLV